MKKLTHTLDEIQNVPDLSDQKSLIQALTRAVYHFFGGWKSLFKDVSDTRNPEKIRYPLEGLLTIGVLMYIFRLKARRQVTHLLRGNGPSEAKFSTWFGVENIPHGDTLNYAFKNLETEEVQEVICLMIEKLIRKKTLYPWRLFDIYYRISIDLTGLWKFSERHCEHCLTQELKNGETLYYHPVLEAKFVAPNGFALSVMSEFVENPSAEETIQDCELKAFYRLAERLKKRFPRLPICLLLDGLYANGPVMQICEDNNWRYIIVLRDKKLLNLHRSYQTVLPHVPENHKKLLLGQQQKISQDYRWALNIEYKDSEGRIHTPNVLECEECKPVKGERKTSKHMWITNFTITNQNVGVIANEGGRLRWKIENEGFNEQKNSGFALEHSYSEDEVAAKVFYYLLQIAYTIFQLLEKGSDFRKAFPNGVGSLKNIALKLLEAWRNLRLRTTDFCSLYKGKYQIRFDTS